MKRNTTGIEAYSKMIARELPSKTKTYTPIAHADVISKVRTEILSAGYFISGEDYKTTNDGQVALGTIQLSYKADPDIQLAVNFLNSYNKQYAFRFSLGGVVKSTQNSIMLNGDEFGSYKRVHKGTADVLAAGKIKEFILESGSYWDALVKDKELLKAFHFPTTSVYDILGKLFFEANVLNTFQMNIIKNEMLAADPLDFNNAWNLYNYILTALRESHPADWMEQHQAAHAVMMNALVPYAYGHSRLFSGEGATFSGTIDRHIISGSGTVMASSGSIVMSTDTSNSGLLPTTLSTHYANPVITHYSGPVVASEEVAPIV